ncbi:phosphoheptose isomerase [Mucilaginibacter sp. PPCGB 2223]|uniref:D-sedoheptulose 7-phosphate isomerase n=1 Tax=Mucilaginibacter sp. PPCGB 2223 TaxID=1886027 RepID=UPI000825513D|nr:D-sedoheptulose 7-phosphate isomerase [Mucilaginibacter sp. PPCGB 2223]OCX53935.1 phosphoheptose isomerase [Mucilaginibacter sp. PPCGB 2223]
MRDILAVKNDIRTHIQTALAVEDQLPEAIANACAMVVSTVKAGNRVYLFGNGGSAADAQHIAAEFTGRYLKERDGLPAIALTTDTSAITAIANDYSFDRIFERQVQALAREGDLLIGISTSGNSTNVLNALQYGRAKGCKTLGLSGRNGGKMSELCDINIVVPSDITANIQEMHILIGHILCKAIDDCF